jgi:hypothetical protein
MARRVFLSIRQLLLRPLTECVDLDEHIYTRKQGRGLISSPGFDPRFDCFEFYFSGTASALKKSANAGAFGDPTPVTSD